MHRSIRSGVLATAASVALLGAPVAAHAAPTTSDLTRTTTQAEPMDLTIGGWAENAAVLPDGDIVVSNLGEGLVQRIDARTHEISTVATVDGPGGLVVEGTTLYVVTGNSPASAVTRQGGVLAIDLSSGDTRTVTSGLGEANGLARLPDGDLVLTVTLGAGTGVHRIAPQTGERRLLTSTIPTPNGVAVAPDGQVYVGSTLVGSIYRVDPGTGRSSWLAGTSAVLDDFGVRSDGMIVGATVLGFIDELDPATGRSRPLASGYVGATSVRLVTDDRAVVTTAAGRVVTVDLT